MRAVERITGASINTIRKLLIDAGNACAEYHAEHVRGVKSERIQCDEIWQFVYAKEKNVQSAKSAPEGAGNTWTWIALDADSKLIVSWLMGDRDGRTAYQFMMDVADRVDNSMVPQITSDGLALYVGAVEDAFGADVHYAQLVKVYGSPRETSER